VNDELEDRLDDAQDRRGELKSDVDGLKRENEVLKTTSLYIASVEEITDDVVIKQHGNNQEVLTQASTTRESDLRPGDRVAINDSFAVQQVLDDETDSRAQAMEVTESPDVTYDDIGGIDDQIREVREAVEDPLEDPSSSRRSASIRRAVSSCTSAGDWEDDAGEGGRQRVRRHLHQDGRLRTGQEVHRRGRPTRP